MVVQCIAVLTQDAGQPFAVEVHQSELAADAHWKPAQTVAIHFSERGRNRQRAVGQLQRRGLRYKVAARGPALVGALHHPGELG